MELASWINFNMHEACDDSGSVSWAAYWATACHALWGWRNKGMHKEEWSRPQQHWLLVYKLVNNYKEVRLVGDIATVTTRTEALISWHPPPINWVKLNTDGSSKNNMTAAGCGGLIRGNDGEWLGGFSKFVGSCSACVAELWGVLEGLKYAWNLGFRLVELHIDSQVVVKIIQEDGTTSSSCWSLVRRIRQFLERDWEIKIQHSYREANKCADLLANIGCDSGGPLIYYESCPTPLSLLFAADIMRVATPHLITLYFFFLESFRLSCLPKKKKSIEITNFKYDKKNWMILILLIKNLY
jgi:ribonuclease HI